MQISHAAYALGQVVWGFPQTISGACVFLANAKKPHFLHHGAVVTVWESHYGLSLGPFVFLGAWKGALCEGGGEGETCGAEASSAPDERAVGDAFGNDTETGTTAEAAVETAPRFVEYLPGIVLDDRLLVHEFGHTIQSLVLGPLYLPVIGLPSAIWLNTPQLSRRRRNAESSYYAFFTERWANHLGERVLGRPSMGLELID